MKNKRYEKKYVKKQKKGGDVKSTRKKKNKGCKKIREKTKGVQKIYEKTKEIEKTMKNRRDIKNTQKKGKKDLENKR